MPDRANPRKIAPRKIVVVMGVAGAGKSTAGRAAAERIGARFYEGDDFHPASNIARMMRAEPLTDADRGPWIDALVARILADAAPSAIVACSALTRFVQRRLADGLGAAPFYVWLDAERTLLARRLEARADHFMPARLLHSQIAALDPPAGAHRLDASAPPEAVVDAIVAAIASF